MKDANLVKWVEDSLESDEVVEGFVIGEMGWGDYGSEDVPNYASQPKGVILQWDTDKHWIDYDFSDGYGSPECNAITVWTTKRVLWVTQYDGSTHLSSTTRHPTNIVPTMPGG